MGRAEKVDQVLLPLELKVLVKLANEAVEAEGKGDIERAQEALSKAFDKASDAYATAQRILNSDEFIHGKAGAGA